jgi:hypothetical protein
MTDTSGLTFYAPLGKWDRDSQSWKTSEATSLWALTLSSLTLPTWGGLHDGELCEHPTPELATSALDYSSLPTPNARDYKGSPGPGWTGQVSLPRSVATLPTPQASEARARFNTGGNPMLNEVVANLLPTPTSQAAKHGELSPIEREGNRPQDNGNLRVVMPRLAEEALLPTPAVNDMGEGKTLEWWDDWAPRQKSSDGRPAPHGRSLAIEALRTLPTPRAQHGEPRNQNIYARPADQPQNLENALHGVITAPPSPDGNTSSDDPHQHQLSLDVQGIPA